MSNFLNRNALLGSAAILSLLGAMYAPASVAGEGHDEHAQYATEAPKAASNKAASQMQQMDHGAMDHGSMSHEGMDHGKMMDAHGGDKAEAGSNHDQ